MATKTMLRQLISKCGVMSIDFQKAFEADMHMHTLVSGHAYGTMREMAAAAAEKGLKLIGITEHAPGVPGTVDPFYYVNLKVIPRHINGVQVLHGCEINVLNDGTLSLEEQYIAKLDYAIAGIHCGLCYEDAGREQNTQNVISPQPPTSDLSSTRVMLSASIYMTLNCAGLAPLVLME